MRNGFLRAAGFLAYTLLLAGAANATVYTIEGQDIPPATVSGTITTDGALGALTMSDIVSTDLIVSDGVKTVVLDGSSVLGPGLTATSTGLFFDYSQAGSNAYIIYDGSHTSAYCIAAGAASCAGVANNEVILVAGTVYQGHVESGEVQIVTTSSVPEPAVWVMMVLGFAGVGLVSYRRAPKPVTGC